MVAWREVGGGGVRVLGGGGEGFVSSLARGVAVWWWAWRFPQNWARGEREAAAARGLYKWSSRSSTLLRHVRAAGGARAGEGGIPVVGDWGWGGGVRIQISRGGTGVTCVACVWFQWLGWRDGSRHRHLARFE